MHFFVQDLSIDTTGGFLPAGNVYKPYFDELTITQFLGELSYQQNERFKVNIEGSYYFIPNSISTRSLLYARF